MAEQVKDPIARFQDQLYKLRQTYVAALGHAEQGGKPSGGGNGSGNGATLVGAQEVHAVVEETLKLAEELLPPGVDDKELEEEIRQLTKEDEAANEALRAAKKRAEDKVEAIRDLRASVVKRVLLGKDISVGDVEMKEETVA